MDKVEVRTVIKYFCKKGISPKEFHDNFIKTLDSPSYSAVKKLAAEFRSGRENVEDYERSEHCKEATTDKNVELMRSLMTCADRGSMYDAARQIGISTGAVQCILTNIFWMSKVIA